MIKTEKEFLKGIIFVPLSVKVYNLLSNESPFYINNHRVHHYQLGLVILLLAILAKNPFFIGVGSGLILDDKEDFIKDFNNFFPN